jgi:AcrR family transcriptional regulator
MDCHYCLAVVPSLREQHRARTREVLLDTAAQLFALKGFRATTLSQIADSAGATTGAVYSNFDGKEELFLAVLERHMEREAADYAERFATGGDLVESARSGGDAWMKLVAGEPTYFPLFVEAWRYALENPKFRRRFVTSRRKLILAVKTMVVEGSAQAGTPIDPDAADNIAMVIFALGHGLALQKILDPEHVPDELFGEALAAGVAVLAQFPPAAPSHDDEGRPCGRPPGSRSAGVQGF